LAFFVVTGVDIFTSTVQFKVTFENGQIIAAGAQSVDCKKIPQICNLAAGGK